MKRTDITFIALMLTLQLPVIGVIYCASIYMALGKIFKNIKDHLLTLTIPTV